MKKWFLTWEYCERLWPSQPGAVWLDCLVLFCFVFFLSFFLGGGAGFRLVLRLVRPQTVEFSQPIPWSIVISPWSDSGPRQITWHQGFFKQKFRTDVLLCWVWTGFSTVLIGVWNVHSLFCNRVGYLSKWYALFIDQLNSVYFHCVIIKLIELNECVDC